LVPRVGGSVPTPRLLQFNITLVIPPSDRGSGGKNVIFSNGPRVNSEYPNPFR
jgi:hypothetical protein